MGWIKLILIVLSFGLALNLMAGGSSFFDMAAKDPALLTGLVFFSSLFASPIVLVVFYGFDAKIAIKLGIEKIHIREVND
jgi:hypothetical protein